MNKKTISIISIFLLIILIISLIITNSFNLNTSNKNSSKNQYTWTVMLYMSGDNYLSEMSTKNLGLLKSVGSTDDVIIVALIDTDGLGNSELGVVELRKYNITPLDALDPSYTTELNMGKNESLEDFIIWSIDHYPARHYLLDIWGHGEGWRGVAMDGNDYLTMPELDDALNKAIKYNDGEKLDIIGFDACSMAMLEVFYQIKDYANIAIASEKDIPERGWPYYDILKELVNKPEMKPNELSKLIVNKYVDAYEIGKLNDDGLSVTLSAVNLNKIDEITNNLEFIKTDRNNLIFYEEYDYVDLYDYAEVNNLGSLKASIETCVIANDLWSNPNGRNITHANGMTIYYPYSYDIDYDKIKFSIDTQWNDWLNDNL